ncbi:hypothetical protein G8V07_11440 [Clostridium botulinum D/C]|uniref:hypothetical protein n=1 Tax=Clostridium botulinum TaxID=1491 RepID=UPI001E5852F5|nr:hypothetical protein [Clostridium botulinum]MCD3319498.1 hypothetical protein [Clostridium botulinum D/C]MCD3324363.1 hypothetical protein [Clostridium botulinum D/C]MCD3327364.1 hypothetical protein [Clostridium botulinum D/C]
MTISMCIRKMAKEQFQSKKEDVIKNVIIRHANSLDKTTLQFCLENALYSLKQEY